MVIVGVLRAVMAGVLALTIGLGVATLLGSARASVENPKGQALSGGAAPTPTPTPRNEQADLAERSRPHPAFVPTRFKARSSAEIIAGIQKNPDWELLMESLVSGPERDSRAGGKRPVVAAPLFVRGLGSSNDEWILPLMSGGNTIAVAWVSLDRDQSGNGYVGGMASWDGTFPLVNEGDAHRLGAAPGDPVISTELVWTYLRAQSDRMQPFWRIVRQSGAVFFLFDTGKLAPASDYQIQ